MKIGGENKLRIILMWLRSTSGHAISFEKKKSIYNLNEQIKATMISLGTRKTFIDRQLHPSLTFHAAL